MAAEWIKMRNNLDINWRVIEMASMLGVPELHVIGMLWKVWSWADQNTADGNALRVTSVTLDRFVGVTGFCNAMRSVGWVLGNDGALTFPNFTEHNGNTAKKRAESNERVRKHRNAKTVTDETKKRCQRREEKRREESTHTHTAAPDVVVENEVQPEAADAFHRFLEMQFLKTGQHVDSIRREALAMDVRRRGDQAVEDLEFSIRGGFKSIQSATDDWHKQRTEKMRADTERAKSGNSRRLATADVLVNLRKEMQS